MTIVNPYDIIKVQSDEDKNHHDCHDVNLHGLNVSFLISMLLRPGSLLVVFIYFFLTKYLTHPVTCDIIIVEIKEVVYTRFLSFEFSKRCAAE